MARINFDFLANAAAGYPVKAYILELMENDPKAAEYGVTQY